MKNDELKICFLKDENNINTHSNMRINLDLQRNKTIQEEETSFSYNNQVISTDKKHNNASTIISIDNSHNIRSLKLIDESNTLEKQNDIDIDSPQNILNKRMIMIAATLGFAISRIFIKSNSNEFPNLDPIYFVYLRSFFMLITSFIQFKYFKANTNKIKEKETSCGLKKDEKSDNQENKFNSKVNNNESVLELFNINKYNMLEFSNPLFLLWVRIISVTIIMFILYEVNKHIKIAILSVILMSSSIFTTIASTFISGKKLKPIYIISFIIIFVLVILIVMSKSDDIKTFQEDLTNATANTHKDFKPNMILGGILCFFALFFSSTFAIATNYTSKNFEPEYANYISCFGITILITLYIIIFKNIEISSFLLISQINNAFLSGISVSLAFYLNIIAYSNVDISKILIFSYSQVPFNFVCGIVVYDEKLNFLELSLVSALIATLIVCSKYDK